MRKYAVLMFALLFLGSLMASACQEEDCCIEGEYCQGNVCQDGFIYECDLDEEMFNGRLSSCDRVCEVFHGDEWPYNGTCGEIPIPWNDGISDCCNCENIQSGDVLCQSNVY